MRWAGAFSAQPDPEPRAASVASRKTVRNTSRCKNKSRTPPIASTRASWVQAMTENAALRPAVMIRPSEEDFPRLIGVDEHVWRHTRRGDKYVTVIIDLTGIREGTGPARLLTRSRAAPSRRSRPGSPHGPRRGATASRS